VTRLNFVESGFVLLRVAVNLARKVIHGRVRNYKQFIKEILNCREMLQKR